jgi:CspA family cold shock protein
MSAMVGRVVRFDRAKGYGFIAPRDGTDDVFLHVHDLLDDEQLIRPGTVVEFDVGQGDRGLKAFDVRIVRADGPTAGSGALPPAPLTRAGDADSDGLCEVVPRAEFSREVTELLIDAAPSLTAAQIVQIRQRLLASAERRGWIDD